MFKKLFISICLLNFLFSSFCFSEEVIISSNGIKLCCESYGQPDQCPIILIMGGGCQGIMWPDQFCQMLRKEGFFVIRYDNRDTGLSSSIDYDQHPYDLMDMAQDAIGILDHFEIQQAHILGISMGGAIAQLLAAHFPQRIKSIVLMATSLDFSAMLDTLEGKPTSSSLSKPKDAYVKWVQSILKNPPLTEEQKIAQHVAGWKVCNGSTIKFDEELYRDLITLQFKRMKNPSGINHHIFAIKNSIEKIKVAASLIKTPTLIIHGTEDPIFPIDHGQYLHKCIKNAQLVALEGMGHNLNTQFYDSIISIIKLLEKRI